MQDWIAIGFLIIAFLGLLIKLLRLLIEFKRPNRIDNEHIITSTNYNKERNTLPQRLHNGEDKKITNKNISNESSLTKEKEILPRRLTKRFQRILWMTKTNKELNDQRI